MGRSNIRLDLFDEFARRFARGEHPDVREYIERAGPDGRELARILDRFLASAPPPAPPEERIELMRAWIAGEPPLLELRRRRGLRRDEVVARLLGLLGLGEERRAKVKGYYHELETGLLEPRGVDRRVWEALTSVLGTDTRELAGWRAHRLTIDTAFRRDANLMDLHAAPPPAGAIEPEATRHAPEPDDEVDRLFRGGEL